MREGDVQLGGPFTFPNEGLHILDMNASHDLILKPGSDLDADYIFTITTGNANRELIMSGDLTVPATGTAALLGTANVFTAAQTINVSSATALLVEQDGVYDNLFVVDSADGEVRVDAGVVALNDHGMIIEADIDTNNSIYTSTLKLQDGNTGTTQLTFGGYTLATIEGVWAGASASGRLQFSTRDGAAVPAERARITHDGEFLIGTTTNRGPRLQVEKVGTQLGLYGGAAAYMTVAVAADGEAVFTTVDPGGTNADITLSPDGAVMVSSTTKLHFLDTAIGIYSQADTFMDLFADGGIRIGDSSAGAPTNYLNISPAGTVTLAGSAKRVLTLRAEVNVDEIKKEAVPDQVQVGVFFGYSMPIYAADHEELYLRESVPGRWDGASDITFHVKVALAIAEDIGDKFQFQLSWNQVGAPDIVPAATHDTTNEVTVVDNTQYATYMLEFTMDYNVDAGDVVVDHDLLAARLRRVAASANECTGEIIVLDWHTHYTVDKMFAAP